jgi:hypothetical protein
MDSVLLGAIHLLLSLLTAGATLASPGLAFEGHITATATQGGQASALLYTVGSNALRIEVTGSERPSPVDLLDLRTGSLTLLFPHNRSFVRLPPAVDRAADSPPGFPGLPPGLGPPTGPGALPAAPGMGSLPSTPALPMMPIAEEAVELKATGQKTNLLGFACQRFEIRQRGEVMEIWATEGLLPFRNYARNPPARFGPPLLEERWAALVTARRLFPLLASLRFERCPERFRFEVLAVTPHELKPEDAALFLPPAGYFELRPPPF